MAASALISAAPVKFDMAAHVLPSPATPGDAVKPFVKVGGPRIALTHVRLIDGTGAPAVEDRTLLIDHGRIAAIQSGGDAVPTGFTVIDATGESVLPGIVGMHDHQFYIARSNFQADGKFDPPPMLPDGIFIAAPVPCRGCDDASDHRQCRALYRPQPQTSDRRRRAARPAYGRHRVLS